MTAITSAAGGFLTENLPGELAKSEGVLGWRLGLAAAAGAEGLIVPVMDVAEWGQRQHELHGRVGPVRAAEYGIPIFRLCSSGISQVIDASGRVHATGRYPGAGEIVAGELGLAGGGRLPVDIWLGPCAVGVVLMVLAGLVGGDGLQRRRVGMKERTQGVSQC